MTKLGPWQVKTEGEWVRFADPHDGRVWSLDGSPRWLAHVGVCCEGQATHYVWTLSDYAEGTKVRPSGSEATLEEAFRRADEALGDSIVAKDRGPNVTYYLKLLETEMTLERAQRVKQLCSSDFSQRGVADATTKEWGDPRPFATTQLWGRALCLAAGEILGEDWEQWTP